MIDQATTARWMGYPDAEAMNQEHDLLHSSMAAWLDLPSFSLMVARGEELGYDQARLAALEEDALLIVSRYRQQARLAGYEPRSVTGG